MYLITYDVSSRRIKSAGKINPTYAIKELPDGAVYKDTLPEGDISNYLYSASGEYILEKEEDNAADQN